MTDEAQEWAVGYMLEFTDGGVRPVIVRTADEMTCERTSETLGRLPEVANLLGDVASICGRPVAHAIIFTCPLSDLLEAT